MFQDKLQIPPLKIKQSSLIGLLSLEDETDSSLRNYRPTRIETAAKAWN